MTARSGRGEERSDAARLREAPAWMRLEAENGHRHQGQHQHGGLQRQGAGRSGDPPPVRCQQEDGDEGQLGHHQELEEMGGGFACVVDGEVRASVPLPLGGLVSPLPAGELVRQLAALDAAAAELGCTLAHPCMTLSFLSLSVIPALKLTDQGLVDVETFTLLPLQG